MIRELVDKISNTGRTTSPERKLEIIELSNSIGLKKASEQSGFGKSTISKWRKRLQKGGLVALVDQSSRPNHQPKKTSQWIIDRIKSIKAERPEMGSVAMSQELERNHSIKISANTVKKIFKSEGLADGDQGAAESSYLVKGDDGGSVGIFVSG